MLIPGKNLPSVREQVELCRNIASQLVSTENSRSKGATMFFKRVKKAHTWEVPQRDSEEQRAIEEEDDEFMRKKLAETLLNATEKSASKNLSLVMNPRGRIHSLSSLKAEGIIVVEHDAVQPDLMSRLMKDLESPEANPRGAELFAKRRAALQKLEDEQLKNQQTSLPVPTIATLQQQQQQQLNSSNVQSEQFNEPINSSAPKAAPLKAIQRTSNANSSTFTRPHVAPQCPIDTSNKRFSLLDPDIFVPSVTCNISSSPWLKYNSSIKSPCLWKADAVAGTMKAVSPVPPPIKVTESEINTRNDFNRNLISATSHVSKSKSLGQLKYPIDCRVNENTSGDTTTNTLAPLSNNNINSNSNNADNYYNYFYQTLKYSNPYQNLPESILL